MNHDVAPMPGEEPARPEPPPAEPQPAGDAAGGQLPPQDEGMFASLFKAKATLAFVIAVIGIFVFCLQQEGQSLRVPFSDAVMQKVGGYSYQIAAEKGQWWRFVSTLFVPRFGLDAIIYLWLFFELGPFLERTLGTPRFCVMYLLAGAGGIAFGELMQPAAPPVSVPPVGTIVAVYALLGAIPGVVLGITGSPLQTVKNPAARSAFFWILLWLAIGWFASGRAAGLAWNLYSLVGTCVFGFLLGAGLASFPRSVGQGVVATGVGLALVLGSAVTVAQGKRWLNGELIARDAIRPHTKRSETGPTGPERLEPAHSQKVADQLRAKYLPLLDRFGPLPSGEGLSSDDYESIGECFRSLDEAVKSGDHGVTTELDDLRIRCLLLLARHSQAARMAEEYEPSAETTAGKALVGVAYYYHGGDSYPKARQQLEATLSEAGADEQVPEARYYLGAVLWKLRQDEPSRQQFQRYLKLLERFETTPAWRQPFIDQAKAQLR